MVLNASVGSKLRPGLWSFLLFHTDIEPSLEVLIHLGKFPTRNFYHENHTISSYGESKLPSFSAPSTIWIARSGRSIIVRSTLRTESTELKERSPLAGRTSDAMGGGGEAPWLRNHFFLV